ncbi:MAG TPA: hypothetical protein ENN07_04745 [candidate division Zixibacteria bacterium]|nr:hypothetical protein [candidate division Zixibacteria bacterium]
MKESSKSKALKGDGNYWDGGTFRQKSVEIAEGGGVRALIDGAWQELMPVELPERFLKWNFGARKKMIEGIKAGQMPTTMAGPHNASVATWGALRSDSVMKINNAVKGTGFLPKAELIAEVIQRLDDTIDSPMEEKLDVLLELYSAGRDVFDITRQVSLELYATPDFETGSFINQMTNPACSLVYMDIPSYELKCVAQLLHPDDPSLGEYEKHIVDYINLIHSYFHGEFSKLFIAVVYHIIEVFDNSPAHKGVRLAP